MKGAALNLSDFLRLPLAALEPVCRAMGAEITVAESAAVPAQALLFDGPSGFVVTIALGEERPIGDQLDDLQIWEQHIAIVVAHRLLPTASPGEQLHASVAGLTPFLDLIATIRDTMRSMQMPEHATGVLWRYLGRSALDVGGIPLNGYRLDFAIDATPPYDDGSPAIVPPPTGKDLEDSED